MAVSLAQGALQAAKELKRVRQDLTLCFRETLIDIGEALVFYTPIKTGLASSNWNVTDTGSIPLERQPIEGKKGAASIDAITVQVQSIKIGGVLVYSNPVDYIEDLEKGSSRQAPAGMVTPTKLRINGIWLANLKKYNLLK